MSSSTISAPASLVGAMKSTVRGDFAPAEKLFIDLSAVLSSSFESLHLFPSLMRELSVGRKVSVHTARRSVVLFHARFMGALLRE